MRYSRKFSLGLTKTTLTHMRKFGSLYWALVVDRKSKLNFLDPIPLCFENSPNRQN